MNDADEISYSPSTYRNLDTDTIVEVNTTATNGTTQPGSKQNQNSIAQSMSTTARGRTFLSQSGAPVHYDELLAMMGQVSDLAKQGKLYPSQSAQLREFAHRNKWANPFSESESAHPLRRPPSHMPNDKFGACAESSNTDGRDQPKLKSYLFEHTAVESSRRVPNTLRAGTATTDDEDRSVLISQIEPLAVADNEKGKKRQLDIEESEGSRRQTKKKIGNPIAESVGDWERWWRENTMEMATSLGMYYFDVGSKMECVMLASSAKIYQRLVVYVYVQMKVIPSGHESLDSLREALSEWKEWDELQWLTSHHVVRRTLWDMLTARPITPPSLACNIQGLLDFDMNTIQNKVMMVLNDRVVKKKFLALCQSNPTPVANLFQTLLDRESLPTDSRSQLARTLVRLAKTSRSYPDCLILTTIRTTGTHPVAGGGFADVWKGYFAEKPVALKALRIYKQSVRESVLKEFSHEAVIWRQLKHPNILPFYGVFTGNEHFERLCLVSPWMDAGNAMDYLKVHPDGNRLSLLSDVAQGLKYLHLFQPPIIHGDLKGANIFVSPSLTACLGDFGLARFRESQESTVGATTGNSTGTLRWQAPELLNIVDEGESICRSEKCDIYSFGCVCLEIMTGKPPFVEIRRDPAVIRAILDRQTPQRPLENVLERGLDDTLWALMQQCWHFDPALRPRSSELAEHFKQHHGAARLGAETIEHTSQGIRASLGQYGFPDDFVSHCSNLHTRAGDNEIIQLPPLRKARTPSTQTQRFAQMAHTQPQPPMPADIPQFAQNFQAHVHAQQQIVLQMQAQQQFVEQQSRTQNGGHTPASNMLQNPAAVTRSQVISNPQVGGRGNHVPGTVQHQTQQIAGPIPIAPGQPLNVLNRDLGRFNPAHMGPMHHRAQQFAQPLGPQITPPLPQPGHTQQQGVTRRSPQDQQAAAQMLTGMPFIYNMTPSQHLQPEGAEHGGP